MATEFLELPDVDVLVVAVKKGAMTGRVFPPSGPLDSQEQVVDGPALAGDGLLIGDGQAGQA